MKSLKQLKEERAMTYQQISDRSGVPVSTIHRVIGGQAKNPGYDTVTAIRTTPLPRDSRYRFPFYRASHEIALPCGLGFLVSRLWTFARQFIPVEHIRPRSSSGKGVCGHHYIPSAVVPLPAVYSIVFHLRDISCVCW